MAFLEDKKGWRNFGSPVNGNRCPIHDSDGLACPVSGYYEQNARSGFTMNDSVHKWLLSLPATLAVLLTVMEAAFGAPQGFKQYTDPEGRFLFDYPAAMNIQATNPNEIRISHPQATLRITVFIESRPRKAKPNAEALLAAFKQGLQESAKDAKIIKEGKLAGMEGSQGFVICSFTNRNGVQLVQLVQYYVSEDRSLQMTISDRPEGFRNLAKVIAIVHESLRIVKPALK
jgi:hypothetical protein